MSTHPSFRNQLRFSCCLCLLWWFDVACSRSSTLQLHTADTAVPRRACAF